VGIQWPALKSALAFIFAVYGASRPFDFAQGRLPAVRRSEAPLAAFCRHPKQNYCEPMLPMIPGEAGFARPDSRGGCPHMNLAGRDCWACRLISCKPMSFSRSQLERSPLAALVLCPRV
jgi:hypothetical protein